MKDLFSTHSSDYAQFRPDYPDEVLEFIYQNCSNYERAWDVGTGNGQVASLLAERFREVEATDISQKQLESAFQQKNIHYSCQSAEKTHFPAANFELIIAAQAAHWFELEVFYQEVKRCAKPNGILVLMGYDRPRVSPEIDQIVDHFYFNTLGAFWDQERQHIDQHYRSFPFPFQEISFPLHYHELSWTLDHFLGYLNTWSALKHFEKVEGRNPLVAIRTDLQNLWKPEDFRKVRFPIFGRMGRI